MAVDLESNEFWGRRSGAVRVVSIKGVEREERFFRQGQWGHGIENSEPRKKGRSLKITVGRIQKREGMV